MFDIGTSDLHLDGNSPLKLFTHAKTTITEIFERIAVYVTESNKFLDGLLIKRDDQG